MISKKDSKHEILFQTIFLHKELLLKAIENNDFDKYMELKFSIQEFVKNLWTIAESDFQKFRSIISLKEENDEIFQRDTFNSKDDLEFKILPSKKNILFHILDFYFIAIIEAIKKGDERLFSIFSLDVSTFLAECTSSTHVKSLKSKGFFDEDYVYESLITEFVYDEFLFFSNEFFFKQALYTEQSENSSFNFMKYKLLFELLIENFFNESFHLRQSLKTLYFIEKNLIKHLIENDDIQTFKITSSHLYSYAELKKKEFENLRFKFSESNDSIRLKQLNHAININSSSDYSSLNNELKDSPEIKKIATASFKLSMLRYSFVRIGAYLVKSNREEMVYHLLYSRQPLEANFINSNQDFFPTEKQELINFLLSIEQNKYSNKGVLEKSPSFTNNDIDAFLALWLFRNYFWKNIQGYNIDFKLDQVEEGKKVGQYKYLFQKIIKVAKNESLLNSIFKTLNGRIEIELFNEFIKKLEEDLKETEDEHQIKIQGEVLTDNKIEQFQQNLINRFNKERSLVNLLRKDNGKEEIQAESPKPIKIESRVNDFKYNIVNQEVFDKINFINEKLVEIQSINADTVLPTVCAKNLSLKGDQFVFNEIKSKCEVNYISASELENILLSNDYSDFSLYSHQINFGYEVLRNKFKYSNVNDDIIGSFTDSKDNSINIKTFVSYSNLKFVMILETEKLNNSIEISPIKLSYYIPEKDDFKVVFLAQMKLKLNLDVNLGKIYFLN